MAKREPRLPFGPHLAALCALGFIFISVAAAQTPPPRQVLPQMTLPESPDAGDADWRRAETELIFAFDQLLPHKASAIDARVARGGLHTLLSLIRAHTFQPPAPEMLADSAIAGMKDFGHYPELSGPDALASLFEAGAAGMAGAVDAYSQFIPPLAARDRRARLFGEVFDIGLNLAPAADGLLVRNVVPERRAGIAGILPGDIIQSIGDASVAGMDMETAAVFLDSLSNNDFLATVRRPGSAGQVQLRMPRVRTAGASSESRRIGDIIYIKLHRFGADAREMIEREIIFSGGVTRAGSRGVLLDMRGNGGGYLDQGAMVANAFLDEGIVVTVLDRNPAHSLVYTARPGDLAENAPMVVLIDHFTASAAEIVAAALQDHRRAMIAGAPSTGKGAVQTMHSLGQLGSAYLTSGRFFRPSGAPLQGNPVIPDLRLDGSGAQDCPAIPDIDDAWIACAARLLEEGTVQQFLRSRIIPGTAR